MWLKSSVMYQIYPLGFCGAPQENDGVTSPRIRKVIDWIGHIKQTGANTILFNPLFESDCHGYDTRDYKKTDCRLGTNDDLKEVCKQLHDHGFRILFDGVFHHVGRGFWAFQDVLAKREASAYCNWFYINFGQDNAYQDGLTYEGWEGYYDLVKLNLKNPEVVEYLLGCVQFWLDEFGIDGLRLDVAYCLESDFLQQLRTFCDQKKPEFALIGEILFGDYKRIVNSEMLHSCTNYECYKGIYSSCNEYNLFEISYSLNRQFGENGHGIYDGMMMMSFCDNHDVSRIASILNVRQHLPIVYGIVYTMPGFPCIYYGSEWGATGDKKDGDQALRVSFEQPEWNELTDWIQTLSRVRSKSKALQEGTYRNVTITNKQLVYERCFGEERVVVAMNLENQEFEMDLKTGTCSAIDLITGKEVVLNGQEKLSPFAFCIYQIVLG